MIYLPIRHIKAGMTLAKDISGGSLFLPLITAGTVLTDTMISKMAALDIPGAYIGSSFCDDIEAEAFINPEYKRKMLTSIKGFFGNYTNSSQIVSLNLDKTPQTAADLVMYLLNKDEFLINIIDIKDYDTYTYSHSMCVGILCVLIGIKLGYSRQILTELAMSGLLHDIGKVDIPTAIINKPGALTPEEFDVIKRHPNLAVRRMEHNRLFSKTVLRGVESHHEKFDGSGYPYGLEGNKIPIFGRILALADVYDALTSQRSYRKALLSSEAIEYMMGGADSHFDYEILQLFLKTVIAYPLGSLVKLSNGTTAIVVKNNTGNTLRPVIRLISPAQVQGQQIDLYNDPRYLSTTIVTANVEQGDIPDSLFL